MCYNVQVTRHLLAWEAELHHQDRAAVTRCWRLHLGRSPVLAQVLNSVSDRPSAASRAATVLYPVRQWGRNIRRRLLRALPTEDSVLHKITAIGLASFFPFFGATLFYFEQIKNICLSHMFWVSLAEQSGGDSSQLPFEFVLVLLLLLSILGTMLQCCIFNLRYLLPHQGGVR